MRRRRSSSLSRTWAARAAAASGSRCDARGGVRDRARPVTLPRLVVLHVRCCGAGLRSRRRPRGVGGAEIQGRAECVGPLCVVLLGDTHCRGEHGVIARALVDRSVPHASLQGLPHDPDGDLPSRTGASLVRFGAPGRIPACDRSPAGQLGRHASSARAAVSFFGRRALPLSASHAGGCGRFCLGPLCLVEWYTMPRRDQLRDQVIHLLVDRGVLRVDAQRARDELLAAVAGRRCRRPRPRSWRSARPRGPASSSWHRLGLGPILVDQLRSAARRSPRSGRRIAGRPRGWLLGLGDSRRSALAGKVWVAVVAVRWLRLPPGPRRP